jgi:Na+-transporting methylmalonyl-CoA/oxaloacetate decarboxylase gamma subunit
MAVNWGYAGQIGGIGFALVLVVLTILAVTVWVVGLLLKRIGAGRVEAEVKKGE